MNAQCINDIDTAVPILGAVGRSLPLLTHHCVFPVTPRDIKHSSYIDDVALKLTHNYLRLSSILPFPLFIFDFDSSVRTSNFTSA